MANPEMVKNFLDVCESINGLASRKMVLIDRSGRSANKTREEVEEEVNTAFWLAEEAAKLPVHMLPNRTISSAASDLNSIKIYFDQLTPSGPPKAMPAETDTAFSRDVDSAVSTLGTWLPLLALRSGNIENLADRTKKLNAEVAAVLEDTQRQVKGKRCGRGT